MIQLGLIKHPTQNKKCIFTVNKKKNDTRFKHSLESFGRN